MPSSALSPARLLAARIRLRYERKANDDGRTYWGSVSAYADGYEARYVTKALDHVDASDADVDTFAAALDVYERVRGLLERWEGEPDTSERPRRFEKELMAAMEGQP